MTEAVSTGVKVDITPPLKTQLPIRIDEQHITDVKSVSAWYVRFYKVPLLCHKIETNYESIFLKPCVQYAFVDSIESQKQKLCITVLFMNTS